MRFRTSQAAASIILLLGLFAVSNAVRSSSTVQGQTSTPLTAAAPCGDLGQIVTQPVVDPSQFCPEYLLQELPHSAVAAITSIAYAPECETFAEDPDWCGALFFVRPDTGALMWVGEHDPVSNTYALHTFATGLMVPNGLVWHDDSWFVSGDQYIYRLSDIDGDGTADSVETLVDDLPAGQGQWTGSIALGPDERIYFSKGASCANCEELDLRRGTIMSAALDGSDLQILAHGLHYAFDFAWHPSSGELWASESARDDRGSHTPLEELNRITEVGHDYGWPACDHQGNVIDQRNDAGACDQSTPAEITFDAHSRPSGMVFYQGAAFPEMQGDLLVVASGTATQRIPSGYALYRVCFDDAGDPEICTDGAGLPLRGEHGQPSYTQLLIPVDSQWGNDLGLMHIQGQSFFPDHPVDVAVSPEGYIAISVMEGRLIQVRPAPVRLDESID